MPNRNFHTKTQPLAEYAEQVRLGEEATNCKMIRLTEQEAENLILPTSNSYAYLGHVARAPIPPHLMMSPTCANVRSNNQHPRQYPVENYHFPSPLLREDVEGFREPRAYGEEPTVVRPELVSPPRSRASIVMPQRAPSLPQSPLIELLNRSMMRYPSQPATQRPSSISSLPALAPRLPSVVQEISSSPVLGQGISANYQGNREGIRNQSANIDPELSTSVVSKDGKAAYRNEPCSNNTSLVYAFANVVTHS